MAHGKGNEPRGPSELYFSSGITNTVSLWPPDPYLEMEIPVLPPSEATFRGSKEAK